MQQKIKISFEASIKGCVFNIQKVWQHDNTLFVLSKFTMPVGEPEQAIQPMSDEISVELDHELPVLHFLIVSPSLPDTDFVVPGYTPAIVNHESEITGVTGELLYEAKSMDSETTIHHFVTVICSALPEKLKAYNEYLDVDQRFTIDELLNADYITQLLNKNEHTEKEKFIFYLLNEIVSELDHSVSSNFMSNDMAAEVMKRLGLPVLDPVRWLFWTAEYKKQAAVLAEMVDTDESRHSDNHVDGVKTDKSIDTLSSKDSKEPEPIISAPVTKPDNKQPSPTPLSSLSFFAGVAVGVSAAVVAAVVYTRYSSSGR